MDYVLLRLILNLSFDFESSFLATMLESGKLVEIYRTFHVTT